MHFTKSTVLALVYLGAAGAASLNTTTTLPAAYFSKYNSQRVQINYGPFVVPPGEHEIFLDNVPVPCTNCMITYMRSGLEYTNGTAALPNGSTYMRFSVNYNRNRPDNLCPTIATQRFFASGSEMTAFDPTMNGTQMVGYPVNAGDGMSYIVDIINEHPTNVTVYGTTIFEYIPQMPAVFTPLFPMWLDFEANCNDASQRPAFNNATFNYTGGMAATVPVTGMIVQASGHLDDGGVSIEFLLNNSTNICNGTATYAQTAGYIDPMGDLDKDHISTMTSCYNVAMVKKGDTLNVRGLYNTTMWPPFVYPNNGTATPVMGIGLAYVANGTVNKAAATTNSTTPMSTPIAGGASSIERGLGFATMFTVVVSGLLWLL